MIFLFQIPPILESISSTTSYSRRDNAETSGAILLGLQRIEDDLLDHVVGLIGEEVVAKLGLVGASALVPRRVPDSGVDLDACNAHRSLVGGKVPGGDVQNAKVGAVLERLVTHALEDQGEGGAQRPCPGVVGTAEGGSGKIRDCRVSKARSAFCLSRAVCQCYRYVPVKLVRLVPKLLRTPPQPSKMSEVADNRLVALDLI